MNTGGAKRFMARLIESGLQTDWLRALQSGQQPARKSGLQRGQGPIQQLHDRGVIKKAGKDCRGVRLWVAGPFLQDYLRVAEDLQGARP